MYWFVPLRSTRSLVGSSQRSRQVGLLARTCSGCGEVGTLRVKEVQDLRRWGPFRLKDREPYRLARCTNCKTVVPVRRDDPVS
ncbi:MAG: hypothetical protein JWM64_2688 [Frankiales bacterium]|nr:hypothetical protein [Frankiales bacterium]